MINAPIPWLLLVISLPSSGATARMRIWRSLKTLGCGMLRDGVYLLPQGTVRQEQLQDLCDETIREGGNASLLTVTAVSAAEDEAFRAMFSREEEYAEFRKMLATARRTLGQSAPQEISRLLRKLRKDYEALRAIDYFPGDAAMQAESDWMEFVHAAETALSPGEPLAVEASIPILRKRDYQGRTWATRRGMWVDRVASAWLIRRFIDPKARFLWLQSPADCPADALGFDFDGATFTHVGERVTFEVLLASFGLEQDPGLMRLGAMVHALDVGGGIVPEAAGFEAMLDGARQRVADDDQLLVEMSMALDSLHAHFSGPAANLPDKSKTNP